MYLCYANAFFIKNKMILFLILAARNLCRLKRFHFDLINN